jgi:hypothetical protein
MSFSIIKAETRTQQMIDWFSGICQTITDFIIGSKIRSKFETLAVEMEAQDFAFYQAVKKAIPVSIYQAFIFALLSAIKASGVVTFSAAVSANYIKIPARTQIATLATDNQPEKVYEVVADTYLTAGNTTVQVAVVAVTAGAIGNTPANTITVMKSTVSGITGITNAAALTNGLDRETEDQRKVRFQQFISTLVRATISAVEYGAKTAQLLDSNGAVTEQVILAKVIEPYIGNPSLPAGSINCYIYNGSGGTSDALVAMAQQVVDGYIDGNGTTIPGYKAAGVICTVAKAVEVPTNITLTVTAESTQTTAQKTAIQTSIIATLTAFIQTLGMGETLLNSKIVELAMGIDGVYNVVLTAPSADTTVADDHIITPGTITPTVS